MKYQPIYSILLILILSSSATGQVFESSFQKNGNNEDKYADFVEPLIDNNWTTYTWPYNAYYPESDSGVNGHVPNGCGPTAMARIMHYWEYPNNGVGSLNFVDVWGCQWDVNLANQNLRYFLMPYSLAYSAPLSVYKDTAKLLNCCGVVAEFIQMWNPRLSGDVPDAFVDYFNYDPTVELVHRWNYTKEQWINIFKREISQGRPIMMTGRTVDSPAPYEYGTVDGHWWVCDGYNEDDEFYINYSFGGIQGYYDIDDMGIYCAWNEAIIGLLPGNLTGVDDEIISAETVLRGNYPNPFNPVTTISYDLNKAGFVQVEIFDMKGGRVKTLVDQPQNAGQQSVVWHGVDQLGMKVGSGLYFYKLTVDGQISSMKKCVLIK